jgi:SAM-dependent MidA family methyltransferase
LQTLADIVRERGGVTVAAFMELALYRPETGYYARAAQRSGRAGDFFTSVDVGPLFGQLLAIQIEEMTSIVDGERFDLVEAGAGNGRLSADILRTLHTRDTHLYQTIDLHLVEASRPARGAQRAVLDDVGDRLQSSAADLPASFEGVLIANELLDAMPVHQVVMRADGLREVFIEHSDEGYRLCERLPSTPRLAEYLDAAGARLEPGWRGEINLNAVDWVRDASRRLRRGFMILIDYGHEARDLYSASHSAGTLTTFSGHRSAGAESRTPEWLQNPGEQDITAHVDFTSVRAAAESGGMATLGFLDQTYFLLALVQSGLAAQPAADSQPSAISHQQLKTLVLPGGLGSTMKVLILGKKVGRPALRGCSFRMRVT